MRVFVLEWVTGGGCIGGPLPPSLAREGAMMRDRLVLDLTRIAGVQVSLALDPRLPCPELPADVHAIEAATPDEALRAWLRLAGAADACVAVAPEGEPGVVALYQALEASGVALLGCRSDAVALTADKRATKTALKAAGIAVPSTQTATGWVVKPRFGAGCVDTRCIGAGIDPLAGLDDPEDWIVEPWIDGAPASLSLLCADGEAWLLACNRQVVVKAEGVLHYAGAIVGGLEHRRTVYEPLGKAIAGAIPGLWGFVGVDLVDGAAGPVVIEVNPRPTTSYVGLGRSLGLNPMRLLLDLRQRPLRELAVPLTPRPVEVRIDG